MKKSRIMLSLFLVMGTLVLTSCGDKTPVTRAQPPAAESNTVEIPPHNETKKDPTPNHNVRAVNLRQAESFSAFAYSSIVSIPQSNITGKVGLRPGVRSLISIDPAEVAGGVTNVFAADDKDEVSLAYLKQVNIDIINAYNNAETRVADADKLGLWDGNIGNKVLVPGVYEWKSSVTVPLDLTLEGTENDVWIFKIKGQLRIGSDVHMALIGGAKASNVFWQVGDDVIVKSQSGVIGTVISQKTFEMKEQATLLGRAFSKNDKLVLDKNTITLP